MYLPCILAWQKQEFSLEEILQSTAKIIPEPEVAESTEGERGQLGAPAPEPEPEPEPEPHPPPHPHPHPRPIPNPHPNPHAGSKQLRTLRKRLERNRLTMPLFDTRGWVRRLGLGLG